MNRICCIMDFDGFNIKVWHNHGTTYRTQFFVREIGTVRVRGKEKLLPCSFLFDLRGHFDLNQCSPTDRITVEHQSQQIIGLPVFSSSDERPMDYDGLLYLIKFLYQNARRGDADVVAYKGGHREKDILNKLKIPHVNLESFGCPKYEHLIKTYEAHQKPPKDCGHHILAKGNMVVHCTEAEVCAYRDWLIKKLSELEVDGACGRYEEHSRPYVSAYSSLDQYSSSSSD